MFAFFRVSIVLAMMFVVAACAHHRLSLHEYGQAAPEHSATTPADRLDQPWWSDRHADVLLQIAADDPDIILIGDSITHGWDNHMDIWNSHFGAYTMVNMGFSGDRTQHVLWRFDHGELDGIAPELAVVMIGTNNSNREDNTADEIGEGIGKICAELRERLPDTEVLLLAIFPRGPQPDAQRAKNAKASDIARRLARSDERIHYLDISDAFLNPDGRLSLGVMPDYLHPNAKGYRIWADAIADSVHKYAGD